MSEPEWSIVFYVDDNGRRPVSAFLESLDDKTAVRLRGAMQQLRMRNTRARAPLVRHLRGKLWELRDTSNTNSYRLLYFFFTGRRIVFVHGFLKKTQRTPEADMALAEERMVRFLAQVEGGGN